MIPAPLVILAVAIGAAVVKRIVGRHTMRRYAAARGWAFHERDDELATTFTLPPFADLPALASVPAAGATRAVQVRDVAQFSTGHSQAMAFTFDEVLGSVDPLVSTSQVVALHTRQRLPRTMVRAGIDVYVLPCYEGMQRIREPKRWVRGGVLSIISAEPQRASDLPYEVVAGALAADRALTLVIDGDWLYAYRQRMPEPWRIPSVMALLETFARMVDEPAWPSREEPTSYVYGQV